MFSIRKNISVFILLIGVVFGNQVLAQEKVSLSEQVLIDTRSGKNLKFSDFSSKKAVVVIFTSSDCAFSMKYQERINKLHEEYAAKEVSFVAINSNDSVLNSSDAARLMRIQMPYEFPYIKDASQAVASALEASRNPEAFVLIPRVGGSYDIAYRGQIDDNPLDASFVENHYLKNALDAVIGGNSPPVSSTEATGCNIKWHKK
ncbi:MAG: redoxin family protein [Bacteroidota bacterium]